MLSQEKRLTPPYFSIYTLPIGAVGAHYMQAYIDLSAVSYKIIQDPIIMQMEYICHAPSVFVRPQPAASQALSAFSRKDRTYLQY